MKQFTSIVLVVASFWFAASRGRAQSIDPLPLVPGQPATDPKALGTASDQLAFWRWWLLTQDAVLDLQRNISIATDPRIGLRRVLESDLDRVLHALMNAQSHPSAEVRAAAALALGKSTERIAIGALLGTPEGGSFAPLFDPSFEVRRAAILGLGAARDVSALETLAEIVKDAKFESELKAVAAIAIGSIEIQAVTGVASTSPPPASVASVDWFDPHALVPSPVEITALALDPAGKRAALGYADGRIALWPLDRDKLASEWKAHSGPVTGIVFTADGERVASISSTGSLRVRMLTTASDSVRFDGLGGLGVVALDASDQWLAVGNVEGEVVRVPMSGKKEYLERRTTHVGAVTSVGFSAEFASIVSTGADGLVKLQALPAKSESRVFATRHTAIRAAALSRDGRYLAVGLDDGKLERFALDTPDEPTWTEKTEGGAPLSLGYDARDAHLLVVDANGKVELRAAASGSAVAEVGVAAARGAVGADIVVVAAGDGSSHSRRFVVKASPDRVDKAGDPGAGASGPAATERRRTVLQSLLAEKTFLAAEPLVQDGIAIAAGLTRDPALYPSIVELIERSRGRANGLSAPTLGFLAISAARLLAAGAVADGSDRGALLLKLAQKDALAPVRRAAVYGLGIGFAGRGGDGAAESIVSVLIARLEHSNGESDRSVKNAIFLTLGRIGGDAALRYLRKEIQSTDGRANPAAGAPTPKLGFSDLDAGPFQAVALALSKDSAGYRLTDQKFKHEGLLGYRCALALALGMHGPAQRSANPELIAALKKERSPALVAHLALAIGLARALDGKPVLLSRLDDPKCDATVIPQLAIGAALLEVPTHREVPRFLAAQFSSAKTPTRGAALAFSLGLVGDVHSVEPLLGSLNDPKLPIEVRVACVTALGMLLDPSAETALARLRTDLDAVNEPRLLAALGVFELY